MIQLLQDIQPTNNLFIPALNSFEKWSLLVAPITERDLVIKIVTENESAALNKQFRHKEQATNVLSFEPESIPGFVNNDLGSLAMCASVINKEANLAAIETDKHWAHLTIHGCLHLLGYDHQTDQQASIMEQLEIEALQKLGFSNPYE